MAASTREAALSTTVSWPTGFDQPSKIVGDPGSAGLWWWAPGAAGSALFHDAPSSGIAQYPLAPVAPRLPATLDYGLAVSATQVVLGIGHQLISLDRSTGGLRSWIIPEGPVDPMVASLEDPDVPSQVLGVAVHDSTVAITVRRAASIEILDENSGTFRDLPIPSGFEARSLAFDANGTLAASLARFDAQTRTNMMSDVVVSSDLITTRLVPVETEWIASSRSGFLAGGTSVQAIDPDASTSRWGNDTTETPSGVPGAYDAATNAAVTAGGNRIVVVSGNASSTWQLPDAACPTLPVVPPLPPGVSASPRPAPNTCAPTIQALTVDGVGTVWAIVSGAPGLHQISLA